MRTYREFIYDIKTTLGKLSDDANFTVSHILYLTLIAADNLNGEVISKKGGGKYLSTFSIKSSLISDSGSYSKFSLPSEFYGMINDGGIKYIHADIIDDDGVHHPVSFQRIDPSSIRIINMGSATKPSMKNPYFYVVGGTIRLLGINCTDMLNVEVGMYSPISVSLDCKVSGVSFSLDDKIAVDEDKISILRYRVLDMCRYGIQLSVDNTNDGSDTTSYSGKSLPANKQQKTNSK